MSHLVRIVCLVCCHILLIRILWLELLILIVCRDNLLRWSLRLWLVGLLWSWLSLSIGHRPIVLSVDLGKHLYQVIQLVLVRKLDDNLVVLLEVFVSVLLLQLDKKLAVLCHICSG